MDLENDRGSKSVEKSAFFREIEQKSSNFHESLGNHYLLRLYFHEFSQSLDLSDQSSGRIFRETAWKSVEIDGEIVAYWVNL